ncbi:MAG: hypothetical protein F6J95_030920 [Leptolyngbya sp. SIO1E4]|nr:hypothetical protein [Leptolyngbya sp. SIO1E4]
MTHSTERFEVAAILIARLLIEMGDGQQVASGSLGKVGWGRGMRLSPNLNALQAIGQWLTRLSAGSLSALTTPVSVLFDLGRDGSPIFGIPFSNDWHRISSITAGVLRYRLSL